MLFTIGRRQYDYQPNAGMLRKINGLATASSESALFLLSTPASGRACGSANAGLNIYQGPSCSVALIIALA